MLTQAIAMLLGIWLMAAPALLRMEGTAEHLHHILGPLIAALACIALWEVCRGLRWANVALGLAAAVVPWLLAFEWLPLLTMSLSGAAVALFSALPAPQQQTYGGGWRAVWERQV